MDQTRLIVRARIGLFELVDDLQNAVAADDRVIDDEFESGGVFEDHGPTNKTLNTLAMAGKQIQPALLLLIVAENTDKHHRRVEITRNVHVVYGHQAGFADGELAPDDFANLPFQELAYAL